MQPRGKREVEKTGQNKIKQVFRQQFHVSGFGKQRETKQGDGQHNIAITEICAL